MIINFLSAAVCSKGFFFNFPAWYEFLKCSSTGSPELSKITDIWAILAAVIDILLRLAALLAVGMIIYGGATYMTSQGSSDKTNRARETIISAAVGLLICSISIAIVHFVGGIFKK
jgi:hypothetical protein